MFKLSRLRLHSVWVLPAAALLFFALASTYGLSGDTISSPIGILFAAALIPLLIGTVFAAVHHAEVIARRTGEPYGTLVLTAAGERCGGSGGTGKLAAEEPRVGA